MYVYAGRAPQVKNRENLALYGTERESTLRQPDDSFYKRFAAECSRVQVGDGPMFGTRARMCTFDECILSIVCIYGMHSIKIGQGVCRGRWALLCRIGMSIRIGIVPYWDLLCCIGMSILCRIGMSILCRIGMSILMRARQGHVRLGTLLFCTPGSCFRLDGLM